MDDISLKGLPSWTPRKINGSKYKGTSGANKTTPNTTATIKANNSLVDATSLIQEYKNLQIKIASVQTLIDKSGETLTICSELPASITERFLRQKKETESCWQFYKRMVSLAYEFPDFDPYNADSFAERMAKTGNDVLTDPFGTDGFVNSEAITNEDVTDLVVTNNTGTDGGEQRENDYNENPGKATLLLMLFLAILKLIMNSVMAMMSAPMKFFKKSGDQQAAASATGFSTMSATGGGAGASAFGTIIKQLLSGFILNRFMSIAQDLVMKQIAKGPKLTKDVERYDAVICSKYVQEKAYTDENGTAQNAVLQQPHLISVQNQVTASQQVFSYFQQKGLQSSMGSSTNSIPADAYAILSMQRDFANSTLDRMTALFLNQLSTQMLCCLFKYLGGMGKANLKNLKRMLAILKLSLNGRGALISRADINLNNLWAQIQKAILAQLVPILSNLLSDLNSTLKKDLSANSTIVAGQCASWRDCQKNGVERRGDCPRSRAQAAKR